jgi:hypothetical protein
VGVKRDSPLASPRPIRRSSKLALRLRKPLLYPLSYRGTVPGYRRRRAVDLRSCGGQLRKLNGIRRSARPSPLILFCGAAVLADGTGSGARVRLERQRGRPTSKALARASPTGTTENQLQNVAPFDTLWCGFRE